MSFLLNSKGVKDQVTALYALSNPALEAEANAIKSDFRSWVDDHFALTNAQKNCLAAMPNKVVQFFGDQCWYCFMFRLPITLDDSAPAPTGYGKWTESSSTPKLITGGDGSIEATGELVFKFLYRPTGG